jgi:ubiquinone/menaquinone biosynthesis C-methylase UbiE
VSDEERARQEQAAEIWSRAATTYGQVGPSFFSYFGGKLVELAPIPTGGRVLDVATGRGALLFSALEKVGSTGEVIGIDYSPGMVELTAAEVAARGITNARVLRMDAGHLQFDDETFDCVLCGFALFFVPDLARALAGFHRVLKPGGVLAVSTWTKWDERWKWLDEMRPAPTPPDNHGGPSLHTEEGMQEVMRDAGFTRIKVVEETKEFFYDAEEEWWQTMWSHGARFELEGVSPEEQERIRTEAFEKIREMRQPEGIPQRYTALFTIAHKPLAE